MVIFVDAKIQFLLHISKQCQKFFLHRMEAFQLLEKPTYTEPTQQVQSNRLYDYMHKYDVEYIYDNDFQKTDLYKTYTAHIIYDCTVYFPNSHH